MDTRRVNLAVVVVLLAVAVACAPRKPKVAATPPPPDTTTAAAETVPPPPRPGPPENSTLSKPAQPIADPQPVPPRISEEERIAARTIEELNRDSLLKPAFFPLDSSDLDETGRGVVDANAGLLKKNPSWVITVEGHADERGTAEYNIALGERRAVSVKNYLLSLGIAPDRLRTVSYGKEFPFEPGHDEAAYAKNRRAHFVITAK